MSHPGPQSSFPLSTPSSNIKQYVIHVLYVYWLGSHLVAFNKASLISVWLFHQSGTDLSLSLQFSHLFLWNLLEAVIEKSSAISNLAQNVQKDPYEKTM